MAVITNTFQSTSAKGNRETLSDVVSKIYVEDTPIYTMAEKKSLKGSHPEWETVDLRAPMDNAQLEGDEYNFNATTPAVRVGNYTQIFRDSGIISRTQDSVSNAGGVEQVKEAKLRVAVALKKDVELSIVSANASVGGATRRSGSLSTWITSNVSRGATGANGGYNQGTGLTVAPTNGTQRAFSKALMDGVLQQGYQNGANFQHVIVSPYVKSVFATFMSDANVAPFRYAVGNGKKNTIVGNADVYLSPFGSEVTVIPNRVMSTAATARNAFFIDPEFLQWGWLDPIKEDKEVAKTGDAQKFVIIGEGALMPTNEKGFGVAADIFGLTAAS